jgi:hypothetical protein
MSLARAATPVGHSSRPGACATGAGASAWQPYLPVPLGVGVQLGDALVAELLVHVVPAHDILLLL